MGCNRARICGRIAYKGALRHTPAGVPVLAFTVMHRSLQGEGGARRQVEFEMPMVAFESLAEQVARWPHDAEVLCEGFLARKSRTDPQLVLHVQTIELTEQR
jgi:primosomal replication protein N